MSKDEYWRVDVTNIEHDELDSNASSISDFRFKLMEIADKIEAGVYSEASLRFIANNHLQQTITVGQAYSTAMVDGIRTAHWEEVKVQISDHDKFAQAYCAFMEDTNLWLDTYVGDDSNEIEEVIVFIGDNHSEGDTTKFIKTPQKS